MRKLYRDKSRFVVVAGLVLIIGGMAFFANNTRVGAPLDEQPGTTEDAVSKDTVVAVERTACVGNVDDVCIYAPAVDFWPSGSEDASNPAFVDNEDEIIKGIGGEIIAINGSDVVLKTATDRSFTVTFPLNAVEWWNSVRSPYYGNYQIGIGDTLTVDYGEKLEDASTTIAPEKIYMSRLAISADSAKTESIKRYETD